MSTGLMIPEDKQVADAKAFEKIAGADQYTGYLAIIQPSSDLAKPPHKMEQGTFVFVESSKATNLGDTIHLVLLAWRPTARIVNKRGASTEITSYHDQDSEQFKAIVAASEGKQDPNYVNYFGAEYLVWLDSIGKFSTFYCNSKTLRRAAKEQIHPCLSRNGAIKLVEFKTDFIKNANYSWYGMLAQVLENQEPSASPDQDTMERTYNSFQNAKGGSQTESTPAAAEATDER